MVYIERKRKDVFNKVIARAISLIELEIEIEREKMGKRKKELICPECGKQVSPTTTECVICEKKHHNKCLYKVKLNGGRRSYYICRKCKRRTNTDREIIKTPEEAKI